MNGLGQSEKVRHVASSRNRREGKECSVEIELRNGQGQSFLVTIILFEYSFSIIPYYSTVVFTGQPSPKKVITSRSDVSGNNLIYHSLISNSFLQAVIGSVTQREEERERYCLLFAKLYSKFRKKIFLLSLGNFVNFQHLIGN